MTDIVLEKLDLDLCVLRFATMDNVPESVWPSRFLSITRTDEELSIVCERAVVPASADDFLSEDGWGALRVQGPLDFALTGVLSSIAAPLAEAGISLFAVSTFDTDYVLIKSAVMNQACQTLKGAGLNFAG